MPESKVLSLLSPYKFFDGGLISSVKMSSVIALTAGKSSRQDIGQRPLDMIHLFANHPNCLLLHRNRGWRNRFHSMTDLVIAIPDEVDPRRGFRPVLVNFLHQLGGKPRKCRSEEHTSELQSLRHLVCRLLLEKTN